MFKSSRSYICSTRDWSDWSSIRLCIAEGIQSYITEDGLPGYLMVHQALFFWGKISVSLVLRCHTFLCLQWTSDTEVELWPLSLFRGSPLNTALCIWTQDRKLLFSPNFYSYWANCVVCFLQKKNLGILVYYQGLLFYEYLQGKQHLVWFSMVENLFGTDQR